MYLNNGYLASKNTAIYNKIIEITKYELIWIIVIRFVEVESNPIDFKINLSLNLLVNFALIITKAI